MSEKVMIFIIVASAIVAVTLIAAVMKIVQAICSAKEAEHTAITVAIMKEMGVHDAESEEQMVSS